MTLNMLIVPVCLLHVACCLFIELLHVPLFNMLASYVYHLFACLSLFGHCLRAFNIMRCNLCMLFISPLITAHAW